MKAVVVEIKGSVAAILSEDGRISKIKNKKYFIGQEIILKNNSKYIKMAASAAAALMVFVTPAWAYLTPYSYVSLDINPSFEFSINRFDRVLEVKVSNDGEKIVDGISIAELKNKGINEAVKSVIGELRHQGYIIEGKEGGVVVAASSKSKQKTDQLSTSLKNAVEEITFKPDKADKSGEFQEKVVEKEIEEVNEAKEVNEKSPKSEQSNYDQKEKIEKTKDKFTEQEKVVKEAKKNETKDAEKQAAREEKEKSEKKREKSDEKNNKISVKVIEVSQDDVNEAKNRGVTPGKLNLIKKLKEVYPKDNFVEEEWYDDTVQDIMKKIKEYSKDRKIESKQEVKENKDFDREPKQEVKENKNSDRELKKEVKENKESDKKSNKNEKNSDIKSSKRKDNKN